MPGDPEISSQFIPLALRRMRDAGKDPRPVMERFSLPPGTVDEPDVRVPVSVVRAAGEAIAQAIPDPFLGLNIVRSIGRGSFGLLEYLFRSTTTCREVLREFVKYALLLNGVMDITFEEDARGDGVFNHVVPCDSPEMAGRHASEYTVAIVVGLGRELTATPLAPRRAWFCHPRPADTSQLEEFFQCPLDFGARSNGLLVGADVLDRPVRSADPVLHSLLEQQADEVVRARAPHADFLGQVREQIRLALSGGTPGVEQVAARLRMSARTLQRRLAERTMTFERLLEDVRRDAALLHLKDSGKSLAEISYLLGFSDVRAFTRAFKRWTGKAPRTYRHGDGG